MAEDLISHRLPSFGKPWAALAITTILGAMAVGPATPLICAALYWRQSTRAATALLRLPTLVVSWREVHVERAVSSATLRVLQRSLLSRDSHGR